jgi:hypothetical protein
MVSVWVNEHRIDDFTPSAEAYFALEALHDYWSAQGEAWTGIRVDIDATGKFASNFYYDTSPLLDGDHEEAERRLVEG